MAEPWFLKHYRDYPVQNLEAKLNVLPRVLLLGDSIRLAYQPRVAARLAGVAQVDGPDGNGGDTRNLLAHLDAWVLPSPPALVHVNAGLHDIRRERGGAGPAVALAAYGENVRAILRRLGRVPGLRVAWATMTPVDDARHAQHKPFDRSNADVLAYNAVAREVAAEQGVMVNDLHAVAMHHGGTALLWRDGIHLTDDGYRLLGDAVAAFILPMIHSRERGS